LDWKPYWGKGYATEAVRLLIKFAFEELDLLRIYAKIYEYNIGSMKVLEKTGFERKPLLSPRL